MRLSLLSETNPTWIVSKRGRAGPEKTYVLAPMARNRGAGDKQKQLDSEPRTKQIADVLKGGRDCGREGVGYLAVRGPFRAIGGLPISGATVF